MNTCRNCQWFKPDKREFGVCHLNPVTTVVRPGHICSHFTNAAVSMQDVWAKKDNLQPGKTYETAGGVAVYIHCKSKHKDTFIGEWPNGDTNTWFDCGEHTSTSPEYELVKEIR